MAAYINVTFNHFLAIQHWARETGGNVTVDMKDFTMEVKHCGRYFRMYPMFQAQTQGRFVHQPSLSPLVKGFGGWRPYATITHPCSTDKQMFKAHLRKCGVRTPDTWNTAVDPPLSDYVVKERRGSFGRGILGPYRAGTSVHLTRGATQESGDMFVEEFVQGHMLKVWFWGSKPFFAHMDPFPSITGDGQSTVEQLLRQKVFQSRMEWDDFEDLPTALSCLTFQGHALEDVLSDGQRAWIEFRYGPRFTDTPGSTPISDNALELLTERAGAQLDRMGNVLAELLHQAFSVPVIITADAILDDDNTIWWLEMNTNSLMPPEGYAVMFSDLFA